MKGMKQRWRVWLGLTILLLLIGAVFLLPAAHWRVIGWLKGEAFYQGRPTSYWDSEISKIDDRIFDDGYATESRDFVRLRQPASWEMWFANNLGVLPPDQVMVLTKCDLAAVPVLKELFVSSEKLKVRRFAAAQLERIGKPDLWTAAQSEKESVRCTAIAAWKPHISSSTSVDPE
jgi:hypothetical protein